MHTKLSRGGNVDVFMILRASVLVAFHVLAFVLPGIAGGKKAEKREKHEAQFREVLQGAMARWDRDGNGVLSGEEMNAVLENPQVRGDEAAAAVVVRRRARNEDGTALQGIAAAQVMALADDRSVVGSFEDLRRHISKLSHVLFQPGDPNLASFHQGRVGDCYLLSVIGEIVYRNPQLIRTMIAPLPGGAYEVHYGNGRTLTVPAITDAELATGARMGSDHGIWLSVLEKAYGTLREQQHDADFDEDDKIAKDFLGGGNSGKIINLMTGHRVTRVHWGSDETSAAEDRVGKLLMTLIAEGRLIGTGTGKGDKDLPKHISHSHSFAVLAYDPARRMVRVFNPWGNDFTPKGSAGLSSGYPTHDGVFDVPLREFVQVFTHLACETEKPVRRLNG